VNKAELIDELSTHFEGNRRRAQEALDAVVDTVTRHVAKGEDVAITGFGKFTRRIRPAGKARNPQTGEIVKTKKKSVPKFTPGADFKAVVNGDKKAPAAKKAAKPTAKKSTAKKSTAKKTTTRKTTAKKTTARKGTARKAPAKRTAKKTTRR
jgi:DNA-binding protein HU-beta